MLHNHAVIHPQRRFLALACLVSWALGPVIGLGIAAHQLDHHGSKELLMSGTVKTLLHGHTHEAEAADHSHDAVPPVLMPLLLEGESKTAMAAAVLVDQPSPPAECLLRSDPPPDPSSIGPPSPFALCVLLL